MAQSTAEIRYRITGVTGCFMIAIAVLLDLLQILFTITLIFALAADLVTFIAAGIFGLWFLILGVSYTGGSRGMMKFMTAILSSVTELVPVIDAMPALTIGIATIILASRAEDREQFAASTKEAAATQGSNPSAKLPKKT